MKKMKHIFYYLVAISFFVTATCPGAFAQETRQITGKVIDVKGEPLP